MVAEHRVGTLAVVHVFVTDETNLNPGAKSKFFIYGGLVFDDATVKTLSDRIQQIRNQTGFLADDSLKFETGSRPGHIALANWTAAKAAVIEACIAEGARFISYLVLHDIAKNKTQKELVEYGMNTVLAGFNRYLDHHGSHGLALVDRTPGDKGFGYLKQKFSQGLSGPGWEGIPLNRIYAYGATCDGASHLSSAVDIVLGSLRYCVNASVETDVVANMFTQVARLMWHNKVGDVVFVREYGLMLRPLDVKVDAYREEYDTLVQRLSALAKEIPD